MRSTTATNAPSVARPLGRSAKFLLILSASATIALCYLFAAVAMLALLVVILFELLVGIALARFGMLGVVAPVIERHFGLFKLFARSLWLSKGEDCRVPLAREEAPRLFALLDYLAARLGIAVPSQVVVEMNVGAWVELRGWRQGSRATRLGLGYDLLAGLSEPEVEAVLAHEMVHAKLVRRGLKRWLNGGLARMGRLTNELSNRQEAFRLAKKSSSTGAACLSGADACTRLAARLVAAYSRQDEFEADLGAAQLCGAAPLRSSLAKLHDLAERTGRLGWHERVAKLQLGQGYSSWLLSEIVADAAGTSAHVDTDTDPYSSHPSIRDRLAALPPTPAATAASAATASASALELILSPDALADRLVTAIEAFSAKLEARDDHELRGLARKIRSGAETRPVQLLAAVIVIGFAIGLPFSFIDGFSPVALLVMLVGGAGGVWLYRFGRYRDRHAIPVPRFAAMRAGLDRLSEIADLGAEEKRLEERLRKDASSYSGKKAIVAFYHESAFAALGRCDFLEAHVAARLGLAANAKSLPCALAFAIAAGALRQGDFVAGNLRFIRARTALRTPDTLWASAWALFLLNDWATAEALLIDLVKLRPENADLRLILSTCAAHRGKRQTALARAREALALAPDDLDANQTLLGLLLDGGYVREAAERVSGLPAAMLLHPDFGLHRVRLHLLRGEGEAAEIVENTLIKSSSDDAKLRIRLAAAHEDVRRNERAWALYEAATQLGHYPEARLALGRLATRRGQHDEARRHLLGTLNTKLPLGPKAAPPLHLFGAVIASLRELRGPGVPCQAWIATYSPGTEPGPLAGMSFVLFARDEAEARADMRIIADAILPDNQLRPSHVTFRLAPKDRQPVGAVVPGVQYVWQ
jgi:Zn-dependent protease with chaperone function/tetratricopeptide (TPR) repeat protein